VTVCTGTAVVPDGVIVATVCVWVTVVLAGVRVGGWEGIDVVDVCVVASDGALHPDTKSRKITKKAKIERSFIN
jgi:hypothetical protein